MNPAYPFFTAHCEQSSSNSCLAACIAMVRIRTGEISAEDANAHEQMLMQKLGAAPKGLIPQSAALELRSRLIEADPDDAGNHDVVKADLESRRWWHIAILNPAPLIVLQKRQTRRPTSRHGDLVAPLPHHAVVLVAVEFDRFLYLDPWFPRMFQPQEISPADFGPAWTGRYIPARIA